MSGDSVDYVAMDGTRWAWRQIEAHGLTGASLAVIAVLGLHANSDGQCRPSTCRIAKMTNYDLRSIQRAIADLRELELVAIRRFSQGRFITTHYELRQWEVSAPGSMQMQLQVAPDGRPQRRRKNPKNDAKVVHPRHQSRSPATPESPEDSIEDSREERVQHGPFPRDDRAHRDPPPPTASAPPQVVVKRDPAVQPAKVDLDYHKATWNLGCPPKPAPGDRKRDEGLVRIDRALESPEKMALRRALKHPALAQDPDAWRRYVRWVRDDDFLGGRREGGFGATLLQASAARYIDRWAMQDQGPPAPATSSAPMILTTPVLPGMVIPIGRMTSAQLQKDPTFLALIEAERVERKKALREMAKSDDAFSEAPGRVNGHVDHGPPHHAWEVADA